LQAKNHFSYQLFGEPTRCISVDNDIDKENEYIVQKVTGNSIMTSMVGDVCSKSANIYEIK